jgi:hypothetical protein
VEKYDRGGQATYDNITGRMRFTYCIIEATDTNSEHVIFIAFPLLQCYMNARHCYAYT